MAVMPRPSHAHEPPGPADAIDRDRAAGPIVFDRESVRAVDRAAIDEFGIPGIVLMENAARGVCERALELLPTEMPAARRVLIVCGSGNNGGDGYAVARLLHNRSVEVVIAAIGTPGDSTDAGINRRICERMRLAMIDVQGLVNQEPWRFDVIVDAIVGTGLDRPPTGDAAAAIEWINRAERPVLAVDVPSGMDCNSGKPLGACVRATMTVTFVGLKTGFLEFEAQRWLGEVVVADIGAPRELIDRFGRRVALPRRPDAPERGAAPSAMPMRRRD